MDTAQRHAGLRTYRNGPPTTRRRGGANGAGVPCPSRTKRTKKSRSGGMGTITSAPPIHLDGAQPKNGASSFQPDRRYGPSTITDPAKRGARVIVPITANQGGPSASRRASPGTSPSPRRPYRPSAGKVERVRKMLGVLRGRRALQVRAPAATSQRRSRPPKVRSPTVHVESRSALNGAQYHLLSLRMVATPARIGIQRGREFRRIQGATRKDRGARRLHNALPDSECGFEFRFAATNDLVLGARCNLRETRVCEQSRQAVAKHVVPAVRRPPLEEGLVEAPNGGRRRWVPGQPGSLLCHNRRPAVPCPAGGPQRAGGGRGGACVAQKSLDRKCALGCSPGG